MPLVPVVESSIAPETTYPPMPLANPAITAIANDNEPPEPTESFENVYLSLDKDIVEIVGRPPEYIATSKLENPEWNALAVPSVPPLATDELAQVYFWLLVNIGKVV